MLYEVAIIKNPTKKEVEESNAQEKLLLRADVLAKDPQAAVIMAVTKDGGLKDFDANQCTVIVRPFGQA